MMRTELKTQQSEAYFVLKTGLFTERHSRGFTTRGVVFLGRTYAADGVNYIDVFRDVGLNDTNGILKMQRYPSGKISVTYIEDRRGGIMAEPVMKLLSGENLWPGEGKHYFVSDVFDSIDELTKGEGICLDDLEIQTAKNLETLRRLMYRDTPLVDAPIPVPEIKTIKENTS